MAEIELTTPLEEFVMSDKLRTRLRMMRSFTFGEAMTQNPDKWENVTPKVINAMKRFKEEYADKYRELAGTDAPHMPSRRERHGSRSDGRGDGREAHREEERRFFVANNVLNALITSGRLFGPEAAPCDEVMAQVMDIADAFLTAYNGGRLAVPAEEEEETVEAVETPEPVEVEEKEVSVHPLVETGRQVKITRRTRQSGRQPKTFNVGDTVTVLDMTTGEDGTVKVDATLNDKKFSFTSKLYEWETAE